MKRYNVFDTDSTIGVCWDYEEDTKGMWVLWEDYERERNEMLSVMRDLITSYELKISKIQQNTDHPYTPKSLVKIREHIK